MEGSRRDAAAALGRIRAGRPVSARRLLRSFTTMASGPDEDVLLEITLEDGTSLVVETRFTGGEPDAWVAGLRVQMTEVHRYGIALLFLWPLWLASSLALAWLVTGNGGFGVLAAIPVAALIALAFM